MEYLPPEVLTVFSWLFLYAAYLYGILAVVSVVMLVYSVYTANRFERALERERRDTWRH